MLRFDRDQKARDPKVKAVRAERRAAQKAATRDQRIASAEEKRARKAQRRLADTRGTR